MFGGYHQAICNVPPIEVKEEDEWGNSTSQCISGLDSVSNKTYSTFLRKMKVCIKLHKYLVLWIAHNKIGMITRFFKQKLQKVFWQLKPD